MALKLMVSKFWLIPILLVITLFAELYVTQFYNVFAESPSFSRDVIQDEGTISSSNLMNNEIADIPIEIVSDSGNVDDEYNSIVEFTDLPIDILSTTSVSDGKFLNGTLWLSTPIYKEKHLDYVDSNVTFSMYITIFSESTDYYVYAVRIHPERDGTWTKVIWEDEPYHPISNKTGYTNKTLQTIHNYTGFFENGNRYVDLSLDLSTIGFPDRYYVDYETDANYNGTSLNDFTITWTEIPIKINLVEYNWPDVFNPLKLRPGEIRSIDILINSTDLLTDQYHILEDANKSDGFTVNFDPSKPYISQNGVTKTKLIIKAAENVSNGHYTLPVQKQYLTTEGVLGSPYNETIDVEVLPPLPPIEQASNLLQTNSTLSASIPLVISSFFGLGLARFINTKSSSLSTITSGEVLAIDVSVIVGVLIFLTIGGVELSSSSDVNMSNIAGLPSIEEENSQGVNQNDNNNINLTVGLLTASIVYPFAISAIRVLIKGSAEYGIKFMITGFVYLMIAIVILSFLSQ